MRENTVKSIWAAGGAVVNGWLAIPSTWSAEVMAHSGWDSLTIDMQHGLTDLATAMEMMQAISTTSTIPLVRVPWNDPAAIMRSLDMGAYGVICPMVNTRAECEAFVGACRYHPEGYRSIGPTRARLYGGADYVDHANETIITMAMIETGEAVDHLDDILSVPGLDAIYVGPNDLHLSLYGKGGSDDEDPKFLAVLDTIIAGCQRHHIIMGIHTGSTAYALKMIERGAQFVTIGSDSAMLGTTAAQAVSEMRGAAKASSGRKEMY